MGFLYRLALVVWDAVCCRHPTDMKPIFQAIWRRNPGMSYSYLSDGIYAPYVHGSQTDHLIRRAREFNHKLDVIDERSPSLNPAFAKPIDYSFSVQIQAALAAICAGLVWHSWECVAQGVALLQETELLLRQRDLSTLEPTKTEIAIRQPDFDEPLCCGACGGHFPDPIWHCPGCNQHVSMGDDYCKNWLCRTKRPSWKVWLKNYTLEMGGRRCSQKKAKEWAQANLR
jgi:hypothetical protein